jgi:hypothetical protein
MAENRSIHDPFLAFSSTTQMFSVFVTKLGKTISGFRNPNYLMSQTYAPGLIELLRATIQNVEQTSQIYRNDCSPVQLRAILDRRVADLERTITSEFVDAASEPIPQNSLQECD